MKTKILLVDDEENILSGYQRNLRTHFDVRTAAGGPQGIIAIRNDGPFAVVVSDFKMPTMNGNQFLAHVKEIAPDTVRMMLTGYADLPTTIEAVNQGNIFRLLTKPCPNETLINTIKDGIKQYKLLTAEKELLDKTLKGTIKVLIDILSSVNPTAFSRVSRLQRFVPSICKLLNISNKWELEISALLSQIGLVTMPPELLERKYLGENLSDDVETLFSNHPSIGKSLICNIPRLESVAEVVYYQLHHYSPSSDSSEQKKFGVELPLNSRILKVLNDYDTFIVSGFDREEAFDKLREKKSEYDPNVLIALDATIAGVYDNLKLLTVPVEELHPGVVAAEDIKDNAGQILITKGAEITDTLKMKLINYSKLGHIRDEIKVLS